jgi:hypothetical protein
MASNPGLKRLWSEPDYPPVKPHVRNAVPAHKLPERGTIPVSQPSHHGFWFEKSVIAHATGLMSSGCEPGDRLNLEPSATLLLRHKLPVVAVDLTD